MSQSFYSYCGTKLVLILEDSIAENYNAVASTIATIVNTNGTHALFAFGEANEVDDYNKVADVINFLIEVNGGSIEITEEDMSTRFLVKV